MPDVFRRKPLSIKGLCSASSALRAVCESREIDDFGRNGVDL